MASGGATAGIAALTALPTNRLLHSLTTDEVVQVHIDLKREDDRAQQARLLQNERLQRQLMEYIVHVIEGRMQVPDTVWIDELVVSAFSKDWMLRDQLRFLQNGRELGTHPYKYAFIVRFLTPEQQRVLREQHFPASAAAQ